MVLCVFLVALLVRELYLLTIRATPMVRFPAVDSEIYLAWAREIAGGDWLGSMPFYQASLYPYFLAGVIALLGDDSFLIRIVQAAISSLSCVVLAWAVHRSISHAAGWISGLMLAVYPPSIFFCSLIQKTVLDELGMTVLILLLFGLRPRYAWWMGGLLGLTVGALVQVRENILVFIPVILLWIMLSPPVPLKSRALLAGMFLFGTSVVIAMVAWRNHLLSGEWLITTYQGGANFFIGNNPDANGSYVPLRSGRGHTRYERIDSIQIAEAAAGRALSPGEVSRFWYGRAWDFIREQPAAWSRLLMLKAFYLVNRYETPDTEDQRFYADHSSILAAIHPFWHFGLLLPLAMGGMLLMPRRFMELRLVIMLTAVYAASTIAYFVLARYRYPLVPLLIPFAAGGLSQLLCAARPVDRRRVFAVGCVTMAAAIPANWPTPFPAEAELATSYANAGIALIHAGETDEAERYLTRALEIVPKNAAAHFGMGQVWLQRRKPAEAVAALETALALKPDVPYFITALGTARILSGDIDAAIDCLRRSTQDDPFDPAAWSNLAEAYKRKKDWASAADALRRGMEANPRDTELMIRLAWLLAAAPADDVRDGEGAMRLAESLLAETPAPPADIFDVLAAAYAESGRFREAIRAAERALALSTAGNRQSDRIRARLEAYRNGRAYRLE